MNELTRRKISLKMRGRKKSATHREHIRQALKGKKKSKEHKEHISEAMKNANKNPYYRLYLTSGCSKLLFSSVHREVLKGFPSRTNGFSPFSNVTTRSISL